MKPARISKFAFLLFVLIALVCSHLIAQTGDGAFRVRVAKGLKKDAAESLSKELKKEGYTPVEVVPGADGSTVFVGAARSRPDAQQLVKDLKSAGFTPEDVEEAGGGAATGASPAAASAPGVSQGTGAKVFRVLVHEFPSPEQAEDGKKTLKDEGFTSVDVTPDAGKFKLYVGTFNKQADAESLLGQIRNAGFAMAKLATVEKDSAARAPGAVPPPLASLPSNLTDTQKQDAQNLVQRAQKVSEGDASYEEYMRLKEELSKQGKDIKDVVARQTGESAEIQNKVWTLYREFETQMAANNHEGARRKLDEIRAVDPKDPTVAGKQQRLEQAMAGGGGAGKSTAAAPAGRAPAGPAPEQVQQLLADARKSETENNPEAAKARYMKVLEIDPGNSEAKLKVAELGAKAAGDSGSTGIMGNKNLLYGGGAALALIILGLAYWNWKNGRRETKLEEQVRELARHGTGGGGLATSPTTDFSASQTFVDPLAPGGMYASAAPTATSPAIGGMGLAGADSASANSKLFGAGMQMPSMGAMIGGNDEEEEESKSRKPEPVEEVEEVEPESDVVSISAFNFDAVPPGSEDHSAETVGAQTPAPLPPPGSDSLSLGDLDLGFGSAPAASSATETPFEQPEAPAAAMSMPDLDLDALLKGTFPGTTTAADDSKPSARIEDISPVQLPSLSDLGLPGEEKSIHDELTLREMDASGVAAAMGGLGAAPTVHIPTPFPMNNAPTSGASTTPPPAISTPQPDAPSNAAHFEQTFDNEAVGSQPESWKGDYDYASLTVDDQNGVDGTGRCLKFEKRSGAGSASYHCNFPNAAGQVTVEFDIRCDDKNKYLLGFYVEKDEDFKQSVHTIVHRIDSRSQPSLRIQGEPIPYDLGTWRHVRYELNLLIGVVNAYVNEQHVVKDAKLPTIPAYVNTLSIRDNLATTGLLYLDNIRITRR